MRAGQGGETLPRRCRLQGGDKSRGLRTYAICQLGAAGSSGIPGAPGSREGAEFPTPRAPGGAQKGGRLADVSAPRSHAFAIPEEVSPRGSWGTSEAREGGAGTDARSRPAGGPARPGPAPGLRGAAIRDLGPRPRPGPAPAPRARPASRVGGAVSARAPARARGRVAGLSARPAAGAGRWWRARGCRSWCGATSWQSPRRSPSCCCRAWWCGASAAWRRTSRARCSDGRARGARGPGGAEGGRAGDVGHGPQACLTREAGWSWAPDSWRPFPGGPGGLPARRGASRRLGPQAGRGPEREQRVSAGWSPARGAVKVRRGARGREAGLGLSRLRGGEPQAKLSEVGRGLVCAPRAEAGGRGTPRSAWRAAAGGDVEAGVELSPATEGTGSDPEGKTC